MSQIILGNEFTLDDASSGDDTFLLDAVSGDEFLLGPLEDEIIYMVGARLVMIGEIIYE